MESKTNQIGKLGGGFKVENGFLNPRILVSPDNQAFMVGLDKDSKNLTGAILSK